MRQLLKLGELSDQPQQRGWAPVCAPRIAALLIGGARLEQDPAELKHLPVRGWEVIGKARREERCHSASVERRNESRRPPGRNPRGRGLLRRGFVARLACSAEATGFTSLLPASQYPSGAGIQFGWILL